MLYCKKTQPTQTQTTQNHPTFIQVKAQKWEASVTEI